MSASLYNVVCAFEQDRAYRLTTVGRCLVRSAAWMLVAAADEHSAAKQFALDPIKQV